MSKLAPWKQDILGRIHQKALRNWLWLLHFCSKSALKHWNTYKFSFVYFTCFGEIIKNPVLNFHYQFSSIFFAVKLPEVSDSNEKEVFKKQLQWATNIWRLRDESPIQDIANAGYFLNLKTKGTAKFRITKALVNLISE